MVMVWTSLEEERKERVALGSLKATEMEVLILGVVEKRSGFWF